MQPGTAYSCRLSGTRFRRGGPQDAVRHPAWPPCRVGRLAKLVESASEPRLVCGSGQEDDRAQRKNSSLAQRARFSLRVADSVPAWMK